MRIDDSNGMLGLGDGDEGEEKDQSAQAFRAS